MSPYEYKLKKLVSIEGQIKQMNIRIIKDSSKNHLTISENSIFEIPFKLYLILYSLDALFVFYGVSGLLDTIKKMKVRQHKNSVYIKAKIHDTLSGEFCKKYNRFFEKDFLVDLNIIHRRNSTSNNSLNNTVQKSLASDNILRRQKHTHSSTQVGVKTFANKEMMKSYRKISWCNLLVNHLYHRFLILTVIFGFFFTTLFYSFHNLLVFFKNFPSKKIFFSFLPEEDYSVFINKFPSFHRNNTNFIQYYYYHSCQEYLDDILAFKASLLPSSKFNLLYYNYILSNKNQEINQEFFKLISFF